MGDMGSSDFRIREAASRQANSYLFAYLAPDSVDPEVQMRVEQIRRRHQIGKKIELAVYNHNVRAFFRLYLVPGKNQLIDTDWLLSTLVNPIPNSNWWEFKDEFAIKNHREYSFLWLPTTSDDRIKFRNFLKSRDPKYIALNAVISGSVVIGVRR